MDHSDWVDQHAKCDIKSLLKAIYHICKDNVKRRNKVDSPIWNKYRFTACGKGIEYITVSREPVAELTHEASYEKYHFQLLEGYAITLQAGNSGKRTITTHWDEENHKCVVQLQHGEDLKEWLHEDVWKMVQFILDPLFFPPQ